MRCYLRASRAPLDFLHEGEIRCHAEVICGTSANSVRQTSIPAS